MVKHSRTICRMLPRNCLSMFNHFVGLVVKGLIYSDKEIFLPRHKYKLSRHFRASRMAFYLQNRIKYKMIRTKFPEIFSKEVLLIILQNSQENNYVRVSFLINLQAFNFIKEDSDTGVFLYILESS